MSACWQHAPDARPSMTAVHAELDRFLATLVAPPPPAASVPARAAAAADDVGDSAHYHQGPLPRVVDGTGGES
jgi:hypothetical protein